MPEGLNTDFSRPVVVRTGDMDWQASPSPSVWRKRLDLAGDKETSRVTSVVRYDPDSAFPSHPHPDGEEILVLAGTFSDEHGDYPEGTFLLNPEGFSHAPFSRAGCELFVKLRQYPGQARRQVTVVPDSQAWRAWRAWASEGTGPSAGVEATTLYAEAAYPETVALLRLAADARIAGLTHPDGAELFLLSGDLLEHGGTGEDGAYGPGAWLRLPPGTCHDLSSKAGCEFYLKRGHLAGLLPAPAGA